jgi:hypothetical protein
VTPEHDERFRRIAEDYLERPGGDYAELLRRGRVSSPEGVDPEQWRAEIRAKARADKVRVITIRSGDRAIAARHRRIPEDQELAELTAALERSEVLWGVAERARALGHEIVRWGAHDEESTAMCSRCSARICVRLDVDPPVVDGKHSTTPARADRVGQAAWAVTGIHSSACRPRSGWRVSRRSLPASSSTPSARSISRRFLLRLFCSRIRYVAGGGGGQR